MRTPSAPKPPTASLLSEACEVGDTPPPDPLAAGRAMHQYLEGLCLIEAAETGADREVGFDAEAWTEKWFARYQLPSDEDTFAKGYSEVLALASKPFPPERPPP